MVVMARRAAPPLLLVAMLSFFAGRAVRYHLGGSETPVAAITGGYNLHPVDVFKAVLDALNRDYVDKITDQKKLTYGAVDNMVGSLNDPYSRFLTPQQRKFLDEAEAGRFHGLGAVLLLKPAVHNGMKHFRLVVVATVPGGPARAAGIKPGDIITRIDDGYFLQLPTESDQDLPDRDSLQGLIPLPGRGDAVPRLIEYKEAMQILSRDGAKVKLTLLRAGSPKPVETEVTLGPVTVQPVESRMLSDTIGYVHVNGLMKGCGEELHKALVGLRDEGARSLVIDLRDSIGGSLDEMVASAGQFTRGTLGYVQRRGARRQALVASGEPVFTGRVVVLMNGATVGTSELLASALESRLLARSVGDTTFGDGRDQTVFPLADGSAIELTTGKLLTASGKEFNGTGLAPDVRVTAPDQQLAKAVAMLNSPA